MSSLHPHQHFTAVLRLVRSEHSHLAFSPAQDLKTQELVKFDLSLPVT